MQSQDDANVGQYGGPQFAINEVFTKAREFAPCYLVFEDLDTIITEDVRSYFLNEVDGLKNNDGIFMIGSTNHLDRLDPGISVRKPRYIRPSRPSLHYIMSYLEQQKRPSRFDRKYLFPDPNLEQRVSYCHFWQTKLKDNKNIEFPDKLCEAIAGITDEFSFAYMQEAFVAALLAIARNDKPHSEDAENDDMRLTQELADDWVEVLDQSIEGEADLEKLVLWVEMKRQIEILREGMEQETAQMRCMAEYGMIGMNEMYIYGFVNHETMVNDYCTYAA